MSEVVCTVKRANNGFIVSDGEITVVGHNIEQAITIFYETVDSKSTGVYKDGMTRAQYDSVVSLIKKGNIIEGVKEIRSFTGMGLREAKAIADSIRNNL